MGINTLEQFISVAGVYQEYQATDEVYSDVGAATFKLGTVRRGFLGSTDMVIRTAASGGGDLLVEDVDYTIEEEDFEYTELVGKHVYTGIKILTVAYQSGDLYFTYKWLGSYTDPSVFNDVLLGKTRVGQIIQSLEIITLSASDPWYNLANPSAALAAANFPDYVPFLRAVRAHTKWTSAALTGSITLALQAITGSGSNFDPELTVGDLTWISKLSQFRYCATRTSDTAATVSEPGTAAAGAILFKISRQSDPASFNYDFPITAYQITGDTSFSLWLNDGSNTKLPENYMLMRALAEAYATDREYGTLTFASAVGGIPAGTYQITGITLANVGTSSAVITCSASGLGSAGSKTANTSSFEVYPHRIAGSTTTARHYELVDSAMMNDGLRNILGLRTRDYTQGHIDFTGLAAANNNPAVYGGTTDDIPGLATTINTAGTGTPTYQYKSSSPKTDSLNETPRTGPRTHPRAAIFNFYAYVGEYAA